MAKTKTIRVTLTRSPIGEKPKTRSTVEGLGLRKLHQTVEHTDTPSIRGMIAKVDHLVKVEAAEPSQGAAPSKEK